MTIRVFLVALFSAMLSGCVVVFTNPLPAHSISLDKRLVGTWIGSEQGNNYEVRFETQANGEMTVSVPNLGYRDRPFRVITGEVSGTKYMILRFDDPAANKDYILARYSITGETLTVCLLDVDKVSDAIKNKKIKGRVSYSQFGGAVITENSKGIVRFLSSNNGLFTCLPAFTRATSK